MESKGCVIKSNDGFFSAKSLTIKNTALKPNIGGIKAINLASKSTTIALLEFPFKTSIDIRLKTNVKI